MTPEIIKQWTESKERSNKYAQNYDKDKITIVKGGKKINVYDMIQEAREDTEIYPTLEKYGMINSMATDKKLIYADISEALSYQDLAEQDARLNTIFEEMPAKERNKFDNDFYKFKQNGLKTYEEEAKTNLQKIQEQQKIEQQKKDEKNGSEK